MLEIINNDFNNPNFLQAYTIADMNELVLDTVKKYGKNVNIKVGDQEVLTRELLFCNTKILFPQNRSIATRTKWKNVKALQEYTKEVITPIVPEGFTYSYGLLMLNPRNQVERVIEILRKDNNSRQATIMLGGAYCLWDKEPPCCRIVDFKIRNGKLNMHLLFRSHDIMAYFPNLWAFTELQQIVANALNKYIGYVACTSESLHLYESDCNVIGWKNFAKVN